MLAKAEQPTIEQLAQTLHDLGISFKDFIHGKLHLPAYRAFYFAKQIKLLMHCISQLMNPLIL